MQSSDISKYNYRIIIKHLYLESNQFFNNIGTSLYISYSIIGPAVMKSRPANQDMQFEKPYQPSFKVRFIFSEYLLRLKYLIL